ncbi:MAG: H+-transporting two-sector ATPase FliI [Candidatus Xenolissoclinum pacificiensis L6]|uniref:H+-transporting two-sector ATPase FliI n=1 Tax=Candidatus Xenolissoclinum pacificiensis L6 TaxID=1401685 RepID=W2V0N4_9RICK|nr:MAG: H+-transporting two-sector ATPase FliI [Candidatus Xenolissoclinum pacificiensis L6]
MFTGGMLMQSYKLLSQSIRDIAEYDIYGTVISVRGSTLKCTGIIDQVSTYDLCQIYSSGGTVLAIVLSVNLEYATLMMMNIISTVKVGDRVVPTTGSSGIYPHKSWLGNIIDPMCNSLNKSTPLLKGSKAYSLYHSNGQHGIKQYLLDKIDTGIKIVNTFVTCVKGQRMGVFAGSGIGKSTLLSMIARYSSADVKIIGLIGERNIEVNKFLADYDLDGDNSNTIIVYSGSEDSPVMRHRATLLTMALSEYFRDLGLDVVCILDSLTRFAMARREIGLQIGEMPVSKGYTSGVFEELPKLLERLGPVVQDQKGSITGFLSVLVDGDDYNEVLTDTIRGILDGQIVLSRKIAEQNIFPAIDILSSISRAVPQCYTPEESNMIGESRRLLSEYTELQDLVNLGIYKTGADKEKDRILQFSTLLKEFMNQKPNDYCDLQSSFNNLASIHKEINISK